MNNCWCGHRHISSWQARENFTVNSKPVSQNEYLNIIRVLENNDFNIGEKLLITKLFKVDALPKHMASTRLIERHEEKLIDYDRMTLLLNCIQ